MSMLSVLCWRPCICAVGASDKQDKRLWLSKGVASNYGACLDLLAPGREILSSSNDGDSATE